MKGRIRRYFVGGNTARGFYSLYESNLQGLERLYTVSGGPGTGKQALLEAIGGEWEEQGYDVEYIHSPADNEELDGVIIPALKAGIVDATPPYSLGSGAALAAVEHISLEQAADPQALAGGQETLRDAQLKMKESFEAAYRLFAEALSIHDDWEAIYFENMDFRKADELTDTLLQRLFGSALGNGAGVVKRRFLGAATPAGAVDFVPNLTEGLSKRYFVKGRAGTGKSTMLKRIAAEAEARGLDVEIYHCGFDPHSLDMVIVRQLNFAIFDSTSPHEYFPDREGDEIIDTYAIAVAPGTDERFAEQLREVSARYKAKMKAAIASLAAGKQHRDALAEIYSKAMNAGELDSWTASIREELRLRSEALDAGEALH